MVIGSSKANIPMIQDFAEYNGITYPMLHDTPTGTGPGGGIVYDQYFLPGNGSPYPRDYIIDQEGIIRYANNEIDTEAMLLILADLMGSFDGISGDLNNDESIDVLDIVIEINIILGLITPTDYQLWAGDLNIDGLINILDIVLIVNLILDY